MFLWLRTVCFLPGHILKFRYSSHSQCISSRILSHNLHVFQIIWPHSQFLVLKFEFYWYLRCLGQNIRSPSKWTGWPFLTSFVLATPYNGCGKVNDQVGGPVPLANSQLAVTFGEKLTYLRCLYKRYESWRACIFEVLPILCITSWSVLLS